MTGRAVICKPSVAVPGKSRDYFCKSLMLQRYPTFKRSLVAALESTQCNRALPVPTARSGQTGAAGSGTNGSAAVC